MKHAENEIDMNEFRVPLDTVGEGETYEMRFGERGWRFGFRYGKVWLYDGDFVGLSETTEVRIPATRIRAAVDELAATLAWGRREKESKAVKQDVFDVDLDNWCHDLIRHRDDDGELDPATFARVRRMLAWPRSGRPCPGRCCRRSWSVTTS